MKVGILHGFVGGGGGTEKTLLGIIDALIEKKHDITLYTFSKPSIFIPKEIRVQSVLPFSFPYLGIYQRHMESKLIQKAKNEDIIIQASGGISIPKNKNQKLVIYCHHDFQSEYTKTTTKYRGIWSMYYRPYHQLTQKFLEKIKENNIHLISNSRFVAQSIKNKFNKESTVIYPPVDISEFENYSEKQNQIISITRYSQEKNLEFAIHVMNDIDVKYLIVGNTKTKSNILYYKKLISMIKNNSKIKLFKNIPRNILIDELKNSKVYFHPSPETFGMSVIESIAAGCIPIVPDNSAHRETVPFEELRYKENDVSDAQKKIRSALDGKFDNYHEELNTFKVNYSKIKFKKEFIEFLESI